MGRQTLEDGAEEINLGPQEGPQSLFYELECDVIFYGGHAGDGKSYGTTLDALSCEPWREGAHDDLVFAVALAAWWGQRRSVGRYEVYKR